MKKGYMQLFIYLCRNDNYKISEERLYANDKKFS